MHSHLRYGAVALALLGSVSFAAAQNYNMNAKQDTSPSSGANAVSSMSTPAQLSLTEQQRQAIWDSLGRGASAKAPASFAASVGATLPRQITSRPLPSKLSTQVPQAAKYHYAKVENEVVLVDPLTRKVVDIIKQ